MNKKKLVILLPLVLLAVTATFSVQRYVTAQVAGQSIEVSPPSQEANVDPGETVTVTATLRNRSNNTLPVTVRVEDFVAKGEEGQVELSADSPYSIVSWT